MEAISTSARVDAMGDTRLRLGAADVGVVEDTALGMKDECEGDIVKHLWRFRSGSPVPAPDSLSIVEMIS